MNFSLRKASTIALAATLFTAFAAPSSGIAGAKEHKPVLATPPVPVSYAATPIVQPLPATAPEAVVAVEPQPQTDIDDTDTVSASSLVKLVALQPRATELPRELQCLAGAIYFEAKSESLPGQLAVGRVIVARSKSGRFPNSYCGVVFQPSQFSFVRGGSMPAISRSSNQWRNAVAIAQIAHAGSWRSPVEGALYFHAARVSPSWRLHRIARVDNHVFYR